MAARTDPIPHPSDRELRIVRVFDAPPALVFDAWTNPGHLAQWLGPTNFTCPSCQLDVRPGGTYRACIVGPDGATYWMRGVYREIVPAKRLVFTFAWEDDAGNPVHETVVTLTFTPQGKRTRQEFHQSLFRTEQECSEHRSGWSECLDRLDTYLADTLQC